MGLEIWDKGRVQQDQHQGQFDDLHQSIQHVLKQPLMQLNALSFDPTGNFFATVGLRHIKFWAFDTNTNLLKKVWPLRLDSPIRL